MTNAEIKSLLDQIAANPELTRRLADIVCSQFNGQFDSEVRIAPAMDDEEALKAIQHAQVDIGKYPLVTIDQSGIHVDDPCEATIVGSSNPLNLENYHLPDDVRIDAQLFECEW